MSTFFYMRICFSKKVKKERIIEDFIERKRYEKPSIKRKREKHRRKRVLEKLQAKKENNIVDKIISDTCEALIGAIYLDLGFIVVEKFINRLWKKHLQKTIELQIDAKTKLQEYSLKKFKSLPIYKFLTTTGPKHKLLFKIAVKIQNSKFISATGYSKKDAELKAANLFLKKIGL